MISVTFSYNQFDSIWTIDYIIYSEISLTPIVFFVFYFIFFNICIYIYGPFTFTSGSQD